MTTNTVTRESTSTTRHHNATSTSSIPHYEPCESNKNNIHSILRTQPTPITNIEDLYIVHHEMPHMKGSTLRETIIPATDRADARTPVAIRAARKAQLTPRQRRQLEREAHLLRVSGADAASCNHFVRLHAFVETALSVYVVTERLGCDLEDHCRRSAAPLPEATVCHIMRCVLRAVAYLHEHDVAHNNIAMHNIFIDDTQSSGSGAVVRVGGLSRVSRARDASERAAASRGDVCRCGVLMYNLLLLHGDDSGGGVAVDEAEALRRLSDLFPTTSPSLSSRSNAAKQLVRRLLDPEEGLSASDALRHHFFLHVNATESDPAAVEAVGRTLSAAVAPLRHHFFGPSLLDGDCALFWSVADDAPLVSLSSSSLGVSDSLVEFVGRSQTMSEKATPTPTPTLTTPTIIRRRDSSESNVFAKKNSKLGVENGQILKRSSSSKKLLKTKLV
eukprot:PhM_4_TR2070/c1_g1_i4/m.47680